MEKAQTILKSCDSSLRQLITTLPSVEEEQEPMETALTNNVCLVSFPLVTLFPLLSLSLPSLSLPSLSLSLE